MTSNGIKTGDPREGTSRAITIQRLTGWDYQCSDLEPMIRDTKVANPALTLRNKDSLPYSH